jgi:TolB-like protein
MLHEMSTGLRPFKGDTRAGLISSILKDTPRPVKELRAELPDLLGRIIRRCLEKDPNRRYQSSLDVRNELEDLKRELESMPAPAIAPAGAAVSVKAIQRQRWRWVAAVSGTILLVILILLAYEPLRQRFAGKPEKLVRPLAVLPFQNMMGDEAQEYFVEGIHDALITEIAKIGLKVISRTTVMRYKKTDKPIPQVARELGVDAVIEGSVLRVGHEVRVTAQLIHGATDEHLWADSYNRELANAMAMLAEVTRAIARQIKISLTPEPQERLTRARPVNPEAQDALLKARYLLNRGANLNDARKSMEFFQKAIDPLFAPPRAGLAMAYAIISILGQGLKGPELIRAFRSEAEKAVELDPQLAEARAVRGLAYLYFDWEWDKAEKELKLALELNPAEAFIYRAACVSDAVRCHFRSVFSVQMVASPRVGYRRQRCVNNQPSA